jgi:oligopeptide transport system substrate-binding protein
MHSATKAWFRLIALAVALALIIPVLASGAAAQDGGKVLRVHHPVYPDVVDPQKSSFVNEIDILALAYEGLTRLDTNLETVPAAAESWEYNDDATQITFHIRPDLKYSDGSPLTAENFRYAVERTCDPFTAGEYQYILFEIVGCEDFAGLSLDEEGNAREYTPEEHEAAREALGVRTLDDLTLQVDLTDPTPYFHTVAYMMVFYPVKKEIVDADPDNWWRTAENHIGNGPFTITDIAEDQQWAFAANDNYWQGRPKLDGIDYVYVEDAAVALEAYRAGDLDIVNLEPPQIPEVQNDAALAEQFLAYPTAGTYAMQFNLNQEPFNDPKVRQAFAYAFDRETHCTVIRSGDCTPALSWIPPGLPGSIETEQFAFDPEAAKQALADSSYGSAENLPPIEVSYNSERSGATERAEWMAGQYRDLLGIDLQLMPMDGPTLTSLTKDNSTFPQMVIYGGWVQDYPDPQNWLSVYWRCDSSFAQELGYCNEEFDRLTHLGDTTIDTAERMKYYQQAGQILVDEQPSPFIFYPAANFVVSPAVTGYTPTAGETEWPGQFSSLMTLDITA